MATFKDDASANISSVSRSPRPAVRSRFDTCPAYPKPAEKARARFNIADRATHHVVFDKDAIIEAANDHECFHIRRYILRNLPEYDDCTSYVTDTNRLNNIFAGEMRKLIEFAEVDNPPVFNSDGSLQGVSCKDFEDVSNIADQLLCIFTILKHDNARHGVLFGTEVASSAWNDLERSRGALCTRYAKDDLHVEGCQPITLDDDGQTQRNAKALHRLLDYLLAVIAWWTVRCADSEYWKTQVLAVLAKWAVKIKIISADPAHCVDDSLSQTFSVIERLKTESHQDDPHIRIGGKKKDAELLQTQTNFCNLYCEEKTWIRTALGDILGQVLEALLQDEKTGTPANFFEVCTMMYRSDTKVERSGKIWAGQKHGDILASSNLKHITHCYDLFKLLHSQFEAIQRSNTPPKTTSESFVRVSGAVCEDTMLKPFNLTLYRMDHAITLLIPLLLMHPSASRSMELLKSTAMAFIDDKEVLRVFSPPPIDFALEFCLSTSAWLKLSDNLKPENNKFFDPYIRSLWQSPLKRGFSAIPNQLPSDDSKKVAMAQSELTEKYAELVKWDIRTTEIVVSCRRYVRCIQALAAFLVLGGLAVPFSVGKRIAGVDPFQIATYTWLLAGFILVAAKSLYVDDWPWNDFLHGHVKCHAISELVKVSGIRAQIILLFLLRKEWDTFLVTDGPYNGMFNRTLRERGETYTATTGIAHHGFSIDEPSHIFTMLASGFVPLKVRDGRGEHLICVDGRKGGWYTARSGWSSRSLICAGFTSEDFENMFDEVAENRGKRTVHMLERKNFKWAKVLGVYVKDTYFG